MSNEKSNPNVLYYDRDQGNRSDVHKRRKANRSVLFGSYDGRIDLTVPDWPKDFLGSEGALTIVARRQFDAYVFHANAADVNGVLESALLCAAERGYPVKIGIIGSPSTVGSMLESFKKDAAELGVNYAACCLPSDISGYISAKTADQTRAALKQLLGV